MTSSPKERSPSPDTLPMHRRIRSDLEARILSGDWQPGYRIPYEHELMAEYGCARMTVNRAISALVQSGLVERRRRAGTFVAQPAMDSAVLAIPNLPEEIRKRGKTYSFEVTFREERTATAEDAETFRVKKGSRLLQIHSRHFADDVPFVIETRIINLAEVPEAANLSFETAPPGTWLLENVPWTEAKHTISAVTPDAKLAEDLDIPHTQACLKLERHTWRNGMTVTIVQQIFRGDSYHLTAHFEPGN